MDTTDIEVLQAVYRAFAKRDVEGVLAHADEDIVFSPMTAEYAGRSEAYFGHEGIRDYFRDLSTVWDHITVTPTKFRQVGQSVLVTGKISAAAPGRMIAGSTGWIWRLRDGKVVYGRVYPSAGAAIDAIAKDQP